MHLTIQNPNPCTEFKPTMFGVYCARGNVSRLTVQQICTPMKLCSQMQSMEISIGQTQWRRFSIAKMISSNGRSLTADCIWAWMDPSITNIPLSMCSHFLCSLAKNDACRTWRWGWSMLRKSSNRFWSAIAHLRTVAELRVSWNRMQMRNLYAISLWHSIIDINSSNARDWKACWQVADCGLHYW